MKLKHTGPCAVDVPGVGTVEPGQVVDVPDELAETLGGDFERVPARGARGGDD